MTSNFNYDFGMVFDRYDTNHDGKLTGGEAKSAKKAGYIAAESMEKSIFEQNNMHSSESKAAYERDLPGLVLYNLGKINLPEEVCHNIDTELEKQANRTEE